MIDVPAYIWWLLAACLAPMALLVLLFLAYMLTMGVAFVMDWWRDRGRARRRLETAQGQHDEQYSRVRAVLKKKVDP